MSDVHPRLRKRPPRCTLDCGFKTPESPALRGFVAERCPITGTSLYLVLKSNGLPRPKIRLKKFSFSLKIVPAYISKKLPSQCWPKPLFIAFFNFSRKRPTFAFADESGLHTRLSEKDRTQRLTRRNRGLPDGAAITTLRAFRTFTDIPGPGIRTANFAAFGSWSGTLPKNAESLRNSDTHKRIAVPKASRPRRAA